MRIRSNVPPEYWSAWEFFSFIEKLGWVDIQQAYGNWIYNDRIVGLERDDFIFEKAGRIFWGQISEIREHRREL